MDDLQLPLPQGYDIADIAAEYKRLEDEFGRNPVDEYIKQHPECKPLVFHDMTEVAEDLAEQPDQHADDIASTKVDNIIRKLHQNKWPHLTELSMIKVDGRPHKILDLLYTVLARDNPLDALYLDLSKQEETSKEALSK